MFWVVIDRTVNLTFLLLALVIIGTLLSNSKKEDRDERFILEIAALRQDFRKVMDNNLSYLEKRQNTQAEIQDQYQFSTSRRIDVVENRITKLEKENKALKQQQKIVNNNLNINTLNGNTLDSVEEEQE